MWAKRVVAGAVLPGTCLALWEIGARAHWTDSQILVPPSAVYAALIEFWQSGELLADILASAGRVLTGFLVGATLGFGFGVVAGLDRRVDAFLGPTFHVLRQIPVIAWVPLLVLLAGFGEAFKILTVAIAAFFPIALNAMDGMRNVSARFFDLGRALCFSRRDTFLRIVWPSALPEIVSGVRLSLSRSWMLVVAAELVASTTGIGHRMDWGRQLFQIDVVLLGVAITGAIGLILDSAIRIVERRASSWRQVG